MYRYLEEQVTRYRETEPENESTKLMDFIQKKFGCCGVTSAADYGTRSPPKSCTVTKSIQSYSRRLSYFMLRQPPKARRHRTTAPSYHGTPHQYERTKLEYPDFFASAGPSLYTKDKTAIQPVLPGFRWLHN
ncbi:unnamed protein product [Schistosoma curassoni]|uniref:Uncharacterized protein n=1 Tax=Schistosoma curassoni TaxID=6186 RepID=A0A183KEH8_9TREM|nr:unnamed protein product [Schistosoma curassoni]